MDRQQGQLAEMGAGGGQTSRYRILGTLGIGGMAVVYRARDNVLGRVVALKFLPPALALDGGARARLLVEARAASALDHPNICTIYEIGETPHGRFYIAMACYEGETLKARLARGALPLAEALDIATQVAKGLARAHGLGIVHRDIKPANLLLTREGAVKILDFGIAQLIGHPGPGPEGPPLGTPGYRSPEQARGDEVAASCDVWSLGVILHEMLTGSRPPGGMGGESVAGEALAPLAGRLAGAPRQLDRVLRRMLAKEPEDRYPDAVVLLPDLSALAAEAAHSAAIPVRRARRRQLAAFALLVVATVAGTFLRPGTRRLPVPAFTRLTDMAGRETCPNVSPDGRSFLHVRLVGARSHIFLQPLGKGAARDLTAGSPDDNTQPAFSPDGRQIAFRSERDGGGIFLMDRGGGHVRRLVNFGFNPAWSPSGKQILCATEGITNPHIRRIDSELYLVGLDGQSQLFRQHDAVQPSWSPHGLRVAYWGISPSGQRLIWTVLAAETAGGAGGQPVQVTAGANMDWDPVWSPDGHFLYFLSDRSGVMNLWRVPIDERSGRLLGEPEVVIPSSQASLTFSISQDGRLIVYASDDFKSVLERVDFDPLRGRATSQPPATILATSNEIVGCDASRDGHSLTFQTLVPQEAILTVWTDGTHLRQITNDTFKNRLPRLSPDGSLIAFYSNRGGRWDIWLIGAAGAGLRLATLLPTPRASHPIWSPRGDQIACDLDRNEALINLAGPLPARSVELLASPGPGLSFSASSWSADGKRLAGGLQDAEGHRSPGIVVYSLEERRYLRLTRSGDSPCWLSDGRRLLYLDEGRVLLLDTAGGAVSQVLPAPAGSTYTDLTVSPDDRSLYLARLTEQGDIWSARLR